MIPGFPPSFELDGRLGVHMPRDPNISLLNRSVISSKILL